MMLNKSSMATRAVTIRVQGAGAAATRRGASCAGMRGKRIVAKGTDRDIQIIPSVLPADWANMGQCVKDLEEAGVDRIQFDVMDGNFVPNLTFGPELIAACRKYTKVSVAVCSPQVAGSQCISRDF